LQATANARWPPEERELNDRSARELAKTLGVSETVTAVKDL
jgi:hypothetical protein